MTELYKHLGENSSQTSFSPPVPTALPSPPLNDVLQDSKSHCGADDNHSTQTTLGSSQQPSLTGPCTY